MDKPTPPAEQAGEQTQALPSTEKLQDRIRQRMESKGLIQGALAERAGLTPPALSRILSADREVKIEHIVKIAQALEEPVAALLLGTDAADLLGTSVPLDVFVSETQGRLDAQAEARKARADAIGLAAERDSLRSSLDAETAQVAKLRQEIAAARAEVTTAREQARELRDVKRELQTSRADASATRARLEEANRQCAAESARADNNYLALSRANAQVKALTEELSSSGGKMLAAGAIGTLLGGIFSHTTARDGNNPKPKPRSSPAGKRRTLSKRR